MHVGGLAPARMGLVRSVLFVLLRGKALIPQKKLRPIGQASV
jgi:hypothetical protein